MSRNPKSEIDALASMLGGETGQTLLSSNVPQNGKLLCEEHEIYHKAHKAGLKLPLAKLKELHGKAETLTSHHWKKYSEANSLERSQSDPEVIKAKVKHGAEFHKFSRMKEGLAKALHDRGEQAAMHESSCDFSSVGMLSSTLNEDDEAIVQHKPAGDGTADTLISKGKPFKPLLGYVHRIPHVSMVDLTNDPSKDEHHAYAHTKIATHYGIDKPVNRHLGQFSSHDDAVAAIKKFHKL